jgi:hypothetical protein
MDNGDSFEDPTVSNPFHGEVSVLEDHHEPGDWRVEYFDSDGGCLRHHLRRPRSRETSARLLQGAQGQVAEDHPSDRR